MEKKYSISADAVQRMERTHWLMNSIEVLSECLAWGDKTHKCTEEEIGEMIRAIAWEASAELGAALGEATEF